MPFFAILQFTPRLPLLLPIYFSIVEFLVVTAPICLADELQYEISVSHEEANFWKTLTVILYIIYYIIR